MKNVQIVDNVWQHVFIIQIMRIDDSSKKKIGFDSIVSI